MINLKFLLGLYPKTESIEAKNAALIEEYNQLTAYLASEELARFQYLQKTVESDEFKKKEADIKALHYKNSEAFTKEQEYNRLKKSARIVNYFKVLTSELYKNFTGLDGSETIKEFFEHKEIVESAAFKEKLAQLKALTYKSSQECLQETEYKNLAKSKAVKNHQAVLNSESYKLYTLLHDSDDLAHFIKLRDYANAHPDALKKKKKQTADETAPEIDIEALKEYETLKKDKRFIQYFKFEQSKEFALFNETEKNGLFEKYKSLKELTESAGFKEQKAYLELPFSKKWEQTNEYAHEKAYKSFMAEKRIKDFLAFASSKEFALFKEVEQSGEAAHFAQLEEYIKSDVFKEEKSYLLLSPGEKWKKTEEFALYTEYKTILASEKYKWYTKVVHSPKFDEIKRWKPTFEDNFDAPSIDTGKWLTRYYWGDNTIHDSYSLSDDLHFNTDGKNLVCQNSLLAIETRKEKADGKSWNPAFGFMPRSFDYTSGVINTGNSFRQKYGRFTAKIKMSSNPDITSTFWMTGRQMLPHIDVVKFHNNKYYVSNFWMDNAIMKNINRMFAPRLSRGFYIFELEWGPKELIWRINNLEIKRETKGIPDEEMYVQLSCGLFNVKANSNFPASMQIDWVRCYQKNEE